MEIDPDGDTHSRRGGGGEDGDTFSHLLPHFLSPSRLRHKMHFSSSFPQ